MLTRSRARPFPPNSNTDKSSSENIAEVLCDAASIHSHRISQNVMFATEFALCHHFPRPCQCDSQKTRNTTHLKCCVLPRKIAMEFSKVLRLARKMHLIFWKRRKGIAPTTENDFRRIFETCWYVTKCHACHVKQGYVTRRLQLPQVTTFGKLAIGTAIATSLPTVADGCGRRSDVERTRPHPQPQSKTRTLRYAFGNIEKLTKNLSPDGPSPHARTGFFFLILYRAPPPSPFFSHTTLSHTHTHTQFCHTQFCPTRYFTHNFVTHIFSHTTLSTQFFTHNFLTRNLSHTTLTHTHTIFHTTLSYTIICMQHCHPPSLCVAGMALGDIHLHFAWQARR